MLYLVKNAIIIDQSEISEGAKVGKTMDQRLEYRTACRPNICSFFCKVSLLLLRRHERGLKHYPSEQYYNGGDPYSSAIEGPCIASFLTMLQL
jgi:hypothetical protein